MSTNPYIRYKKSQKAEALSKNMIFSEADVILDGNKSSSQFIITNSVDLPPVPIKNSVININLSERSTVFENEIPNMNYQKRKANYEGSRTIKMNVGMETQTSLEMENSLNQPKPEQLKAIFEQQIESTSGENRFNIFNWWHSKEIDDLDIFKKRFKSTSFTRKTKKKKIQDCQMGTGQASDQRELTLTEKYMGNYDLLMQELDIISNKSSNSSSSVTELFNNRNSIASCQDIKELIKTSTETSDLCTMRCKAKRFFSQIFKKNRRNEDYDNENFKSSDNSEKDFSMDWDKFENPNDCAKRLSEGSLTDRELLLDTSNSQVKISSTNSKGYILKAKDLKGISKIAHFKDHKDFYVNKNKSTSDSESKSAMILNSKRVRSQLFKDTYSNNTLSAATTSTKSINNNNSEIHPVRPVAIRTTSKSIASRIAMLNANIEQSTLESKNVTSNFKSCLRNDKYLIVINTLKKPKTIQFSEIKKIYSASNPPPQQQEIITEESQTKESNVATRKKIQENTEVDLSETIRALDDLKVLLNKTMSSSTASRRNLGNGKRSTENIKRLSFRKSFAAKEGKPVKEIEEFKVDLTLLLPHLRMDKSSKKSKKSNYTPKKIEIFKSNFCEFDNLSEEDFAIKFKQFHDDILANRRYHNALINQKNIEDYQRN